MKEKHIKQIHTYGQSIWLDFIQRSLMSSGELGHMIAEDDLRGMTNSLDRSRQRTRRVKEPQRTQKADDPIAAEHSPFLNGEHQSLE